MDANISYRLKSTKLFPFGVILVLLLILFQLLGSKPVYAQVYCRNDITGGGNNMMISPTGDCGSGEVVDCGGATPVQNSNLTDLYHCPNPSSMRVDGQPVSTGNASTGSDGINKYLAQGINILTAVAGLAIVGSIIFGGIQYTTAGGNASQVSAAKTRITVSVASIILLAFGYALLQWLIPGGIFK